jgi:O-antigen ligase
MPQEYFFNGHLRWSVFWDNPNCWAAFLACLIAWLWCGQTRLGLKIKIKVQTCATVALIALYIIEAGIWFLLVKTYSRGGLVASVVAMVFFFGLSSTGSLPVGSRSMGILPMRFVRHGRLARVLGNILIRIVLIAVLCMATGFASRISPDYTMQDKSILNRLDQWKGAIVMINDSPFHGWGYKLGGMAYQNWYQPLSHTTRPIGFVNSYLEVAVEQGSHVLFLAIVCSVALLLIAAKLRNVTWVAGTGASLVAWMASNLWSSIWLWPGLWILPGLAVVCILVAAVFLNPKSRNPKSQKNLKSQIPNPKGRDYVASAIDSLTVGIVVWVAIVGAGHVLAKDFPFQAKPAARGDAAIVTRRGSREKSSELRTELWVDAAGAGRYWGKTIRTILENDTTCGSFIVYAPWALKTNRLKQPANKCVYSGFQAGLLADKNSEKR